MLTETSIQNILYYWKSASNKFCIPNFFYAAFECDFLTVSKANMITEYEIKISAADFKNDAKKEGKVNWLKTGGMIGFKGSIHYNWPRPNYFYYVVPEGLQDKIAIPDYAGLIIITNTNTRFYNRPNIVKRAPKLHKEPCDIKKLENIMRGLMFRYWSMRLKYERNENRNK